MSRDQSPERTQLQKRTRFCLVKRSGTGVSVVKQIEVEGWKHFDCDQDALLMTVPKQPTPLKKFKKQRVASTELLCRELFYWNIEAPGRVLICEWLGMHKRRRGSSNSTICGEYLGKEWPDELTLAEWREYTVEW